MKHAWLSWTLCAACATVDPSTSGKDRATAPTPDEEALAIPTRVDARVVRIVLSQRFQKEARLLGIRVEAGEPGQVCARGAAEFHLRKLDVNGSEEIYVTWLPDHENFLLYASGVKSFQQENVYSQRTEKMSAVTIANAQVTILP